MSNKDLYLGFDPAKQKEYERYISERYGKEAVTESKKKTKNWTKKDYDRVKEDYDAIHVALTAELKNNEKPSSKAVQEIIRRHFALVSQFWTPAAESYTELGQLYLDHEDFRKLYDGYHPKLAEFLADAMKAFAQSELT